MRRMNVVNRKQALKVVKELDAFPKVPDSYKEQTVTGAGVSFIVFGFITLLIISEIKYYSDTELKYSYEVDKNFNSKLAINIDMTIAMKCEAIGADILDMTSQNADSFGTLEEEAVTFDLTSDQQSYLRMIQQINEYIKNEYHAIHDFLWKSGHTGLQTAMPPRKKEPGEKLNGCRLHGTLTVNKVAGNFHITAGKSLNLPGAGHAHLSLASSQDYNFSHRIDHLSFGKPTPGVINPMDGDYVVTQDTHHMFQYFIQIVPTTVKTRQADVSTYQFSVTDRNRTINHSQGSHGVPGIFMKYDLAPLVVTVREEHKPYWQFLVRLCGIIGGVFATSGLIHGLVGYIIDLLWLKLGAMKKQPMTKDKMADMAAYPDPLGGGPPLSHLPAAVMSDTSGVALLAAGDLEPSSWQQPLLAAPDTPIQ